MSLKSLTIKGSASQKSTTLTPLSSELELSLMDFLIKHGFTIASSCSGEGICKKCVVNDDLISCQIKVKDCLELHPLIAIAYL